MPIPYTIESHPTATPGQMRHFRRHANGSCEVATADESSG